MMDFPFEEKIRTPLFKYLLNLGDDNLILGHRLSEWCGHAPILEEDIALTNIALDCIGQANALLELAGKVEEKGRSEDDLAYLREAVDFRNIRLVEQPNIDFAYTIARQFFYDAYMIDLYDKLSLSAFEPLAGIASKSFKETKYHLRHSTEWMLRLGDGTAESHDKLQKAVDDLWRFTGELTETFGKEPDKNGESALILVNEKIVPDTAQLKRLWEKRVGTAFMQAGIEQPEEKFMIEGSRNGNHSEHLGHLLAEMQIVARSFPGAKW